MTARTPADLEAPAEQPAEAPRVLIAGRQATYTDEGAVVDTIGDTEVIKAADADLYWSHCRACAALGVAWASRNTATITGRRHYATEHPELDAERAELVLAQLTAAAPVADVVGIDTGELVLF